MYQAIEIQLQQLKQILKTNELWEETQPTPESLTSTEPFAIDQLDAHQWLQWIFIPKMQELIIQQATLPSAIAITPYIEEALKEHPNLSDILQPLLEIENLLQNPND